MARESGLSVSALRFYDQVGLLVPARVDAGTGYRTYRVDQVRDARLIARLRRVGMRLPDVRLVLEQLDDREVVNGILADHLRRLETGLADARRELSAVHAHLDHRERTVMRTQITVNGNDLLYALQAARKTVSTDPAVPMLGGVFLDIDSEAEVIRVVATDRYRLLVIPVDGTDLAGTSTGVIAPLELIDDSTAALSLETGPVTLGLDGDRIVIASSTGPLAQAPLLDYDFPDYQRAIRGGSRIVLRVDADRLRSDLADAPTTAMRRESDGGEYDLVTLNVDADDRLSVASDIDDGLQVGVNREFLLQALEGVAADDLTLELDGPIAPLVIRDAARADVTSMLMPVRLD